MRFKWQKEPSSLWNGLCLIDIRSPIAQAHIFVGSNKTPGLGMSVLSTILGGSCWQVSVDSIWLLPNCLLFQLMKTKWVRWNKEKTPLGNEVDWLAQVFVGAIKKSRRCFPKESTTLFKRSDDAKRKQSIYSQISFNCYAVGSSCLGIDVEADYFVEFRRKEVGYTLHVSIWVRFLQIYLPPSKHIKINMIHNFKNFVTFLEWFSLRGWCFEAVVFISLD